MNRAPLEFCGYSEDEVLGKILWETPWFNRSKEVQEIVRDAVERVLSGEAEHVEIELTAFKKNGTSFPTIFSVSSFRYDGELKAVVEEQKKLENELRITIEKLKAAQEELMTPVVQIWAYWHFRS